MSIKSADAKKRRALRKKKKDVKKDPLKPKKIESSFDNAFMNLSSDVLLRHFTNKNGHDIYVLFDRRLNLNDGELRELFVNEEAEEENTEGMNTFIRVSAKKKIIEQKVVKETELHRLVVTRYLNEKKKFF
ncbi:MAG: hypothetical protein COA79_14900 [Planctomycetota bacterium]|nr:MAG: hypothetical protein COA79_14900 [Planctomycetota bacterium]